ncbi:MAG: DegT/DnrJ/EryC1/StrS family aminotransferase [Candidatus Nitronauta litoralis]|uniref:DegT/DnrJ/EryC1/StrS family aminotransferase n=1 Tax=Candidatus Nitronauta litoralis TaxID=2705533 RepID=A0A7T0G1U9_9BACT|nr:MAG: DegT/DnrJ/EryC1/StrS family aminotransferase [Candidatus Nitronauta litoralis]
MYEVIRSGKFILGPQVKDLEDKIAEYCQSRFAVGVSSGTDALVIALMTANVGPGDEVITSPFTFFATVGSIVRVGAKPVFVDIDPVTFNLDPSLIPAAVNEKTKAIIPVHLYGQCAEMEAINSIAKENNLVVIEDAAQAIGSEYKDQRAGSLGDMGCFSFFPTKNLGGMGDGGLVTTNSEDLFERLKILRVHGSHPKYYHKWVGGNFRLDTLQAAVVAAKLPYLDKWTQKRQDNADRYRKLISDAKLDDHIQTPQEVMTRHIYNQFVLRVADGKRDALRQHFQKNGIGCEVYYPLSLHEQECFRDLGYKTGDFKVSEKAAAETLALPNSFEVTPQQQEYVVAAIQDFFS